MKRRISSSVLVNGAPAEDTHPSFITQKKKMVRNQGSRLLFSFFLSFLKYLSFCILPLSLFSCFLHGFCLHCSLLQFFSLGKCFLSLPSLFYFDLEKRSGKFFSKKSDYPDKLYNTVFGLLKSNYIWSIHLKN